MDSRGDPAPTGTKRYPLVNDLATLTYLTQMAALEIHVPQWTVRAGAKDPGTIDSESRYPDRMVFDLDPGPGRELADCIEVAQLVRELLEGMGLDAYPVTSGSKGVHLYAPLDGSVSSQQVSDVAHELARSLEADHKDLIVSAMKKTLRENKVLIDWSQNSAAKTTVAPYSLRGRFTPMVAAPRSWDEFDDLTAVEQVRFEEVLDRVDEVGIFSTPRRGGRGNRLGAGARGRSGVRNPTRSRTMPRKPNATDWRSTAPNVTRNARANPCRRDRNERGRTDLRHPGTHARSLHWDFRLEHDGGWSPGRCRRARRPIRARTILRFRPRTIP